MRLCFLSKCGDINFLLFSLFHCSCKIKFSITRCYGQICQLCSRMRRECCVCKAPHNEYGIRSPIRLLSEKQTMTELRLFKDTNTRTYLSTLFDLYQTYISASIPASILPQLRKQLATVYSQLRAEECLAPFSNGPHVAFTNPFDDDSDDNSEAEQLSYAGI